MLLCKKKKDFNSESSCKTKLTHIRVQEFGEQIISYVKPEIGNKRIKKKITKQNC